MKTRDETPTDACLPCLPGAPLGPPLAPEVAADYAQLLRALGDETRLQIVHLLAEQAEALCVCHIESAFGLTQSGISYHLRVLREAGLVRTERRGTWIYYRLNRERLRTLAALARGGRRSGAGGR